MKQIIRVIPRLDIKGPNLVKGIHLEGLRVLGSPESFAKFYYDNGADEIIFQDVVASLYERNSLQDIISKTAKNIFIPITVGGGIRTLDDIQSVLRVGADKVTLNTIAVKNPQIIRNAAQKFGSSTIVVSIECIKNTDGKYYAFIDNGREETGLEVTQWAEQVETLGAGEIVVTSVDNDGTAMGFDIDLMKKIRQKVSIPLICHGGASTFENVTEVINESKVDGLAIASALHYNAIQNIKQIEPNNIEGNRTFLNKKTHYNKIKTFTIPELKNYLKKNNIFCRPILE